MTPENLPRLRLTFASKQPFLEPRYGQGFEVLECVGGTKGALVRVRFPDGKEAVALASEVLADG